VFAGDVVVKVKLVSKVGHTLEWRAVAVRYIGSKVRVVERILDIVGNPSLGDGYFVDAFAGTGAVAAAAADSGWSVRVNDNLYCASVLAAAQVTTRDQVTFRSLDGYKEAIAKLNRVPGRRGFIWREYSPASLMQSGIERRYFTEENAQLIDGMREHIRAWSNDGLISHDEERLLIADLLVAVNRVANIAGTYGCFLREFALNALASIAVMPRELSTRSGQLDVYCGDVFDVPSAPNDVVYYDPPYTKRQYAAYYHILETVAAGDSPMVTGVTGLRPWQNNASIFCYKSKALGALVDLIGSTNARRIFLSYSDEGHVALSDLRPLLVEIGDVTVHNLAKIGRYRPNQRASDNRSSVHEFLVEVVKTEDKMMDFNGGDVLSRGSSEDPAFTGRAGR
jgi:adenine-specific DNA-methyltransferase